MQNILLLIGKDVVSHRVASSLRIACEPLKLRVNLALTPSPKSSQQGLPELDEYTQQERRYGYDNRVAELAEIYRDDFHGTIDVNSDNARMRIKTLQPLAVINFRGFQKFGRGTISFLHDCSIPLVNVHPALLPDYRGLFSTLHAMAASEELIGCTLHRIDADYDTGPILSTKSIETDYTTSVLANLCRLHSPALELIVEFLNRLKSNEAPAAGTNQTGQGSYYGYPSRNCLRRLKQQGVPLVDQKDP